MHVEPVADLARHPRKSRVHPRDLDRHVGIFDRTAGEELGEQREGVEVALERELLLTLEGAEDRPERQRRTRASARPGAKNSVEKRRVMCAFTCVPRPRWNLPLRLIREIPRDLRRHHRAPRERHCDRSAHAEPPSVASVATAHGRNGLWPDSVNQIAENPTRCASRATRRRRPARAEAVRVELHGCQSPIRAHRRARRASPVVTPRS